MASTLIRVVDPDDGLAVPNAFIRGVPWGSATVETIPGDAGTFRFEGPPGTPVQLNISAPGRARMRRSITVGTLATLDVALPRVSALEVQVHDGRTGAPVADASVRVMDTVEEEGLLPDFGLMAMEPGVWAPAEASSITGPDGKARLEPAETGTRRLVFASADGYAPRQRLLDSRADRCLLLLDPAIQITVQVKDSAKQPIPGATVISLAQDGRSLLPGDLIPRTDADGNCQVSVSDTVRPPDAPPGTLWRARRGPTPREDPLARTKPEFNEDPAPKQASNALPIGVLSEFRLLQREACLLVRAPGFGGALVAAKFADGERVNLELPTALEGGVRIVGPDSLPLGGVPVRIVPQLWGTSRDGLRRGSRIAFSEETGLVTVPGVVAGAPYLVVAGLASRGAVVLAALSGEELPKFPSVRVPPFRALTVEVRNPAGNTIPDCAVVPLGSESGPPLSGDGFDSSKRTGIDGTSVLHVFEGQPARVVAFHGPTVWGWNDLKGTILDAGTVQLKPPATLTIKLKSPRGDPVSGASVRIRPIPEEPASGAMQLWLTADGVTGYDGTCRFEVASGLTWEVEVASISSTMLKTVTIDSRSETTVHFTEDARRQRANFVRVLDSREEAVSNAIVSMVVPRENVNETAATDHAGVAHFKIPEMSPDSIVTFRVEGKLRTQQSTRADKLTDGYLVRASTTSKRSLQFEIRSQFIDMPWEPKPALDWVIVESHSDSEGAGHLPAPHALDSGRAWNGHHSSTVRTLGTPVLRLRPDFSPPWYPRVSFSKRTMSILVEPRLRAVTVTVDTAARGRRALVFALHKEKRFMELWSQPGLLAGSTNTILLDEGALQNGDYRILPGGTRGLKDGDDAEIRIPESTNRIHLGPEPDAVYCITELPPPPPTPDATQEATPDAAPAPPSEPAPTPKDR